MRSKQSKILNFCLKYITKPLQVGLPINPVGMKIVNKVVDWGAFFMEKVPAHVTLETVNAGGTRAEWVIAGDQGDNEKVFLFMHGGGYFFGSPRTHRQITWRVSQKAGVKVLSIDYRLIPDHTLNDCWEDALSAYKYLLAEGYNPENIVVGGDSAGGGLVLSTLFRLRDNGLPLPAAAVLISPFADTRGQSPSIEENAGRSHMFHKKVMLGLQKFLATHYDADDYYVSPACGNFENMPPLFIHVSDTELLYGDSLLVKEKAEAAGVEVRYREWENMPHVFTVFSHIMPEAREGVAEIVEFIAEKLKISTTQAYHNLKN